MDSPIALSVAMAEVSQFGRGFEAHKVLAILPDLQSLAYPTLYKVKCLTLGGVALG